MKKKHNIKKLKKKNLRKFEKAKILNHILQYWLPKPLLTKCV